MQQRAVGLVAQAGEDVALIARAGTGAEDLQCLVAVAGEDDFVEMCNAVCKGEQDALATPLEMAYGVFAMIRPPFSTIARASLST